MKEVKNIALYLPQFHCIPENDKAWGKGFTEWTNVKKAAPLYIGHYQPHIPHRDIGYYSLENTDIMVKQSKIAKKYGIDGFCYYYYWFDGKTLLEKPLINMLKTPEVDIPFCLMWANHNWTKTWDAGNKEVIIEQKYNENSFADFIDDLMKYFNDPRYIKIDNKPVLLVYQANLLPDPKKAVEIWRQTAKEKYNIELYLILCQQNTRCSPNDFGYDAALECTPNFVAASTVVSKRERPKLLDKATQIIMYDYKKNIFQYILRKETQYKLLKCVYPNFDNTARRGKKGSWMFIGATPKLFKRFLAEISLYTNETFSNPDEKLVFINAWNEWAEGAHLEPDQKNGYLYLNICKEIKKSGVKALKQLRFSKKEKNTMQMCLCNSSYVSFIKLFRLIPIFKCVITRDKKKYYLGTKILLYKVKRKDHKIYHFLLGFIPLCVCRE